MAETKVCSKCGAKNPAANNFCEQCGTKLVASSGSEKPIKAPVAKSGKSSDSVSESTSTSSSILSGNLPFSLSWTHLIFGILLMVTVFTRFDHLGARAHHHDESMHAFYSWQLFKDGDYHYDPMMHGPLQFHGNALMYYLFGVSDATSRYLAATFGLITVLLAMLLGPFLGRIGTLLATLLIVCSPSFMYFARFTREDAYFAGATFAMVVFAFRYYRSRANIDLWLATIGFVLAFSTFEGIFLVMAVLGTYLFIRLLPWKDVVIAACLTIIAFGFYLILDNSMIMYVFLALAFGYTVFHLLVHYMDNLKANKPESRIWKVICDLGIQDVKWDLLALIGWWCVMGLALGVPQLNLNHATLLSPILLLTYFAILFRFCWLWLKDVAPALTGSIAIGHIIFTLLFTTFFTVGASEADILGRLHGLLYALFNGAFGGLIYWKGQHGVARGGQPWFYYLLQLPANELVSFLFSGIAMIYYTLFKRKNIPLFFAYWYIGSMVLFSWAGEKMPWLVMHPLLPALLLTAYFVGDIWESTPVDQFGRTARVAALAVFGLLATYSLHSAILLSFYHEDNPVESLVYVQSGPDCQEVERIVKMISYHETGGPNANSPEGVSEAEKLYHSGMSLTIEDKCSWPFAWMFREFTHRNHPATITTADNGVILTATESDAVAYPILSKAGYINRKYKMRVWWVPSWYKKGYPSSDINWSTFRDWFTSNFIPLGSPRTDMVDWSDIKKWVLYRQVWSDLGSYNMRVWVRPDLAQKYGFTEDTRSDVPADYPQAAPASAQPAKGHHKK